MRPLKALRYLVRVGCIMMTKFHQVLWTGSGRFAAGALVLRHRVVLEDLALEDPDLHAAGAVGGLGGAFTVVDVRAQGVKRHAAFAVPLRAGDFGAAQTAGAGDADAFGAKAHGRLHGALHGAAERHAALEL